MKELLCTTKENGKKLIITKNKITFIAYSLVSICVALIFILTLINQTVDLGKTWFFYLAIMIFLYLSLNKYLKPLFEGFNITFNASNDTVYINDHSAKKFSDIAYIRVRYKNQPDSNSCSFFLKFTDGSDFLIAKSDSSIGKNIEQTANKIASFINKPVKINKNPF